MYMGNLYIWSKTRRETILSYVRGRTTSYSLGIGLQRLGIRCYFKGGIMESYIELLFWLSIGFAAGVIAYLYKDKGEK